MDIQRSLKFDSRAHRLRSHPSERVRQAADKAIKAKRTEGVEAAEKILNEVPELQEKTLIDVLVEDFEIGNAGIAARQVRSGRVLVEGKIATDLRQIVHLGQTVLLKGPKDTSTEVTLKAEGEGA